MQVLIDKYSFASIAVLIKEKELSSELLPVDNSRPDYPAPGRIIRPPWS